MEPDNDAERSATGVYLDGDQSHVAHALFLRDLLIERARLWLKRLLREIETVTEPDAAAFRRNDWPSSSNGIGLDGSIAGIVYHVAAWKTLLAPVLLGGEPLNPTEFDWSSAPHVTDWPGLRMWLTDVSERWIEGIANMPPERLTGVAPWAPGEIPMTSFLMEVIDHDAQHSSQIEYIKQAQRTSAIHR